MVVGICTITLDLPGNDSLKDKRSVLKPLLLRIRREFNVSVAEVDHQDAWCAATIGVAAVSNEAAYLHGLFEKLVRWIDSSHLDVQVQDWQIEIV
jgi:uncharacterized protein YlxP (DUF503 family)